MVDTSVAPRAMLIVSVFLALSSQYLEVGAQERRAQIREDVRIIETYPFSDPNPVPILSSDARLYPYHRFQGYAHHSKPAEWKVVHLENEWIEVWVLPEVGGKVWGARVKETGHEFIYRNEVMKFRNIALRGPWTSGGIEFNFDERKKAKSISNIFKTDHLEYFKSVTQILKCLDSYFIDQHTVDLHKSSYNKENILTEFEMLFKSKGDPPIGYLKANVL